MDCKSCKYLDQDHNCLHPDITDFETAKYIKLSGCGLAEEIQTYADSFLRDGDTVKIHIINDNGHSTSTVICWSPEDLHYEIQRLEATGRSYEIC